jgi:hypothetical protein
VSAAPVPTPPESEPRIKAAQWFAGQGFGVFPCWSAFPHGTCRCPAGAKCGSPGKHPLTRNGFNDATRDLNHIRTFLSAPSLPNYGLLPPDGVFVLDVDGDGVTALEELERTLGPLPPTMITATRNGKHVFLRWPEGIPRPIGQLFGFVTRWGSGHDAGYVIGPRSVHPSGFEYAPIGVFEVGTLPDEWAHAVLRPVERSEGTLTIDAGGYQLPDFGYTGSRYKAILSYIASRYMRGLSKDEVYAGIETVLAPRFSDGLPATELRDRFERAWKNTAERLGPPMTPQVDQETGEVRMRPPQDDGDLLADDVTFPFPDPPGREAFAGLLGEMVAAILDGTDASEVGLLASLVALCGPLVPSKAYFGRTQTSTPHIALVGESSIGRKGTAMNRALDALSSALGADRLNRVVMDGINSGEGLVTELERRQVGSRGEPTSAVVFEEEFATLLAAAGRDGSSLDSRMRQAFDGGPLSNRKASSSQTVLPPYWLSALVGITPSELQDKGPAGALTSGSANRWLWLPVVRREEDVANVAPELPLALRQALWAAHDAATAAPPDITHDGGVSRLLTDYGKHLVRDATGLAKDLSRRYPIIAFRIGLIHAALGRSAVVTEEHVWRGIALTEYARQGIPWVFGYTVGNELATLILRHLREVGSLTKRDITRDWARDPVKRQRALDELRRLGFAEVVKDESKGGRRPAVLQLIEGRGTFVRFFHSVPSVPSVPPVQAQNVEQTEGMDGTEQTEGMERTDRRARNRGEGGSRVCPACHRNHPVGTHCEEER